MQYLTWQAYMHKKLVRARPMAHVRIFCKDMAHLLGLSLGAVNSGFFDHYRREYRRRSWGTRECEMWSRDSRTLRLALPKIGVGWMFALLTIDFNRIAIVELGVAAVLVTTMLSMHYFLSPFQVIVGRIADRYPIRGYRRTPFIVVGAVPSSCVFALPSVAETMGNGSLPATIAGFVLFAVWRRWR